MITELYAEGIKEVTATEEQWLRFLNSACRNFRLPFDEQLLVYLQRPEASAEFVVELKGQRSYLVALGTDIDGNITRIDNEIEKIPDRLLYCEERLETLKEQLVTAKLEVQKSFSQEEELQQKTARLGGLNTLLGMDKKEHPILNVEPDESVEVQTTRDKVVMER